MGNALGQCTEMTSLDFWNFAHLLLITMPSLNDLHPGQRGQITALGGDPALMQRLMEMGLLEGDEVRLVGIAPLGDPIEIAVGDYHLSLRRSEAAHIQITPLP